MSHFSRFMTSSAAAYRRSERAQQRKTREAARQFKIQQRNDAILNAVSAVKDYTNYINVLKSVHKEATDAVNWEAILDDTPPAAPIRTSQHQEEATRKQLAYKPGLIDKLFGSEKKKRQKLQQQAEAGRQKDETIYAEELKQFNADTEDFKKAQKIANGVLNKDISAYKDAIEFFEPYADISELGTQVNLTFETDHANIILYVNDGQVIPNFILSQTSTGKLSRKNMPATKFNELYQDYVCSCVLRVARETLAYLPVNFVVVNAVGTLFDSTTGYEDQKTILSVVISPEKLDRLNLETIDPSDSMKNFTHHMQFNKSKGFTGITPINGNALIQ